MNELQKQAIKILKYLLDNHNGNGDVELTDKFIRDYKKRFL